MQLKDVCFRTNLSQKTIRYYTQEGLIQPRWEYREGKYVRSYSEGDVHDLQIIASLRRAWFTIDEIRTMREQPEQLPEIVTRYVQWLRVQQQSLRGLLSAAEQLRPERLRSVEQLYRQISTEADLLPLPAGDLAPQLNDPEEPELPPMEPEAQAIDNCGSPASPGPASPVSPSHREARPHKGGILMKLFQKNRKKSPPPKTSNPTPDVTHQQMLNTVTRNTTGGVRDLSMSNGQKLAAMDMLRKLDD